jgi:hypothetical protein
VLSKKTQANKGPDMSDDYWIEHAEIALSEAGLPAATAEQLQAIAGVIESAHEFYGQAMGHDVASANWYAQQRRETQALEKRLTDERAKVTCQTCKGTGREVSYGPYHSSDSECHKCRGEGRHAP